MTDFIQQQLITARENQILDAAIVVFAEKGFHATTIRDIAKQAGVADGTIYNYFENKSALLLAIFSRMRNSIIQAGLPEPTDELDLRTFVKRLLSHPLKALEANEFALFRIVLSEMMVNADLRKLYYEKILEPTLALADVAFQAQAHKLGVTIRAEDAQLTIRAISGTVMGLMVQHAMGDEVLLARWDELPDFLADRIVNCLEAPK